MNRLMQALKAGFRWPESASAGSPPAEPARAPERPAPVRAPAQASARSARAAAKKARPAGLGDVVKAATSALGISPCGGCRERAEWLNRKVPFDE